MKKLPTVLCIIGTRPEAIKMAPVIHAIRARPHALRCRVLATAQHRGLLDQMMNVLDIRADVDLDLMRPNQSLNQLAARLLAELDRVFLAEHPAAILAQGDTTTVMTAALAAFHLRIPFGHVEAGLRTGDLSNPFPEEMNRVVAGIVADWHFAPTESARQNLLREGISPDSILVTGNTVIDTLHSILPKVPALQLPIDPAKRLILVTMHRRENFGEPMRRICRAIRELVQTNADVEVLLPVHPNPSVGSIVREVLGSVPAVRLCEPLEYLQFIAAMRSAYLILSDSGGVQEEAPALGKPVLVLRNDTERPEAIASGVARLVGDQTERIVAEAQRLLDDAGAYREMARGVSPYGDGKAAGRIVDFVTAQLLIREQQPETVTP